MDGVIMDNQSERSTVEPAVTPTLTEDTSQARSRSTSQTFPDRRLSGVRVDEGSGGTLGFGPIRDGPPVATPCNALSESTSRTSFVAKTYPQPLLRSVFRSCSRYTQVDLGSPNGKVYHESTDHLQVQHQ